jgi:hypothetical protein
VIGTDDVDDVHTFATDDRERAEEVAAIMREELENVELNGTISPMGKKRFNPAQADCIIAE